MKNECESGISVIIVTRSNVHSSDHTTFHDIYPAPSEI